MSTTRDFRLSLIATLEAAFQIPFVSGPRNEPRADGDLGCVWLEGKTPMPRDGNMEQITYGVRILRYWLEDQDENETNRNVDRLEDDLELVQTTLAGVLTTTGHHFFNVASVSINWQLQAVDAALIAFQRNMGARGG